MDTFAVGQDTVHEIHAALWRRFAVREPQAFRCAHFHGEFSPQRDACAKSIKSKRRALDPRLSGVFLFERAANEGAQVCL